MIMNAGRARPLSKWVVMETADEYLELVLVPALGYDEKKMVVEAVAGTVWHLVDQASIDLISDHPWPRQSGGSLDRLMAALVRQRSVLRGRQKQTINLDIDVADDREVAAFLDLVPYTISAEAWCGSVALIDAADSGSVRFQMPALLQGRLTELVSDRGMDIGQVLVPSPPDEHR